MLQHNTSPLTPLFLLSSGPLNFSSSSGPGSREKAARGSCQGERERGGARTGADGGEHEDLGHDHLDLDQEEHEGEQWGKAGPGGAYWRPCAVTGQGFLDKMVGTSEGHLQFPNDHQCTAVELKSPSIL